MNKTYTKILKRGLKRLGLAFITMVAFAISVLGFIEVATAPGYLAVLQFILSVLWLGTTFVLLYAQGATETEHKESQGEDK